MVSQVAQSFQSLQLLDHYQFVLHAASGHQPSPADLQRGELQLHHQIELKDVWFRYNRDLPWALCGVNLTIRRGESIALVGVNGAGKSTLVKLLCRMYEPDKGSIRWDGQDIRTLPSQAYWKRLGVLFQDFVMYDLTAAENIAVGDLACLATPAVPAAAARAAGAHDLIERLPRGYETMLSRVFFDGADDNDQPGVMLSLGQWQRVALARALLRTDCDLLILDEPSSGLDALAEKDIHERVAGMKRDRTTILISHRLNTVADAGKIVVLSGGVVAEEGTHGQLMGTGGLYAEMFTAQAAGYDDMAGL